MNIKAGLTGFACLVITACSTIQFDRNTASTAEAKTHQQWHHNFVFALYEGSKPVNLVEICPQNSWQSVKTEVSFLNVLAAVPANYFAPIWYPQTVDISCTAVTNTSSN
jgi:hypothetical protein